MKDYQGIPVTFIAFIRQTGVEYLIKVVSTY